MVRCLFFRVQVNFSGGDHMSVTAQTRSVFTHGSVCVLFMMHRSPKHARARADVWTCQEVVLTQFPGSPKENMILILLLYQ